MNNKPKTEIDKRFDEINLNLINIIGIEVFEICENSICNIVINTLMCEFGYDVVDEFFTE